MVASMTAFARFETSSWTWEIRSLNHRFLDLAFNLPAAVHALEPDLRTKAKEVLNRGHVEATLVRATSSAQAVSAIDVQELQSLLSSAQQAQEVMQQFNGGIGVASQSDRGLDLFEVLRWPGVLKEERALSVELRDEIHESFAKALAVLVESRKVEGESLRKLFTNRLALINENLAELTVHAESQVEFIREKLAQRIEKLGPNAEPRRVAQEIALLAQRADVHEEIDRLNVHIDEFENCLRRDSSHGRRLGFIVQEMARESNTLAAKLAPPDAVTLTVDLKVLIDQIREQVQNIE